MTRSVFRIVEWRLVTDPPHPVVQAVCASCGAHSAAFDQEDRKEAEVWAREHTGRHPSHRRFRGVATSVWRMVPLDAAVDDAEAPPARDGVLDDVCGALTYLPDDMLTSYRRVTGRDLANLVVLCVREPGHDPAEGHCGSVLDRGTHYWP